MTMKMKGLLPEANYAQCANGFRIHYLDEGQGDVVVFLHGSGPGASGYSNFKGNYPALVAGGYRCIIPDHIGYGFSDKPTDRDHPLEFFVECIKQTLDVIGVARIAAIQAAKRTSELIPLCHPLALTKVAVDFELDHKNGAVECVATVETVGRTGVEMEALTGVSVGLLTIYDMCKAVDRAMRIEGIRLLEKRGGRSGHWVAANAMTP